MSGHEEIVVTRVGAVTGAGVDSSAMWSALCEGRGAPGPVRFATDLIGEEVGFEVPEWKADRFWRDRKVSYYTRAAQFALKATEECIEPLGKEERSRLGVVIGSQYATVHNCHRNLDEPTFMTPIKFLSALPSSTPTNISLALGLRGITTSLSSSAAGLEAIGYARDLIASCHAPSLLAGGTEELSPEIYAGGRLAGVLPEAPGAPGLVPGEAAAVLLLEKRAHAEAQGREPLACLAGMGTAYAPGRAPGKGGGDAIDAGRRAFEAGLAEARVEPDEIDAVFVAANGHRGLDNVERGVLASVFGQRPPATVALKARLGETFAAFGALAAVAGALSLRHRRLPGARTPERLRVVAVHDFGCEGNHAALILRRPDAGTIQGGA